MNPHKRTIRLSDADSTRLQNITKKGEHNAREVTRARILLRSYAGESKNAITRRLETSRSTVQAVRARFHEGGIERALADAQRPGAPKKITEAVETHLVAVACSKPPEGHDVWTLEMLRHELIAKKKVKDISTVAIWHHLHDRGIKPWREKNAEGPVRVVRPETHA